MIYYASAVHFNYKKAWQDEKQAREDVFEAREIYRMNNYIRRLMNSQPGIFAAVYEAAPQIFKIAAALEAKNGSIERLSSELKMMFGKKYGMKNIVFDAFKEIHTEQFFSECLDAAYDADYLDLRTPSVYSRWNDIRSRGEFRLGSALCSAEPLSLETALERADTLLASEDFREEIVRIFSKDNAQVFIAHPVQYRIVVGQAENALPMVELLLDCLYANHRLQGRRWERIFQFKENCVNNKRLEQVFCNASGVAIVLDTSGESSGEGMFASGYQRCVDFIAPFLAERHRDTLFILVESIEKPGFAKKLMAALPENMEFICLQEGAGDKLEAEKYLAQLIERSEMAAYQEEQDVILAEDKSSYSASEIYRVFQHWQENLLRNRIYGAYRSCPVIQKAAEVPRKKAYDELQELIGLQELKTVMRDMVAMAKLSKIRRSWGFKEIGMSRHMVFTGNPGSAKTTAARLLARIFAENGIQPTANLVECGRADLVGRYVGWTAKLICAKFREASGGVLFIDEAYALVDGSHSFGDEAINTIVQEMENHRDDVVVILAGYPEKMAEFLEKNEGLKSRIAFHLDFPDYNDKELLEILELMAAQSGYQITLPARKKCRKIFQFAAMQSDFGNGRFVRNLFERAIMHQSVRLGTKEQEISLSTLRKLTVEDFSQEENRLMRLTHCIGFSGTI